MRAFFPALIAAALAVAPLPAQSRPAIRDSAGIRIVESVAPIWTSATGRQLDPAPALILGTDGSAAQQFGKVVGAVRLRDGTVAVADAKALEIRLFRQDGEFIRSIGRNGEGPGDIRGLGQFLREGDTLVVSDYRLHRVTAFAADGKIVRIVAVGRPPEQVDTFNGRVMRTGFSVAPLGMLPDHSFLGYHRGARFNPPTGIYNDSISIDHVAANGQLSIGKPVLLGQSYTYDSKPRGMTTFGDRPFTAQGSIATAEHTYWYASPIEYELREYSIEGKLLTIVRLRRTPAAVTRRDIAAYEKAGIEELKTEKFKEESSRQTAIDLQYELYKWLDYPKTMAAFSALKRDPAGNLWAREYGDSTRPEHWDVFDKGGRLLGNVDFPAGMTVYEIGTDYVLALLKDEDDVDTVRVYRFRR